MPEAWVCGTGLTKWDERPCRHCNHEQWTHISLFDTTPWRLMLDLRWSECFAQGPEDKCGCPLWEV